MPNTCVDSYRVEYSVSPFVEEVQALAISCQSQQEVQVVTTTADSVSEVQLVHLKMADDMNSNDFPGVALEIQVSD